MCEMKKAKRVEIPSFISTTTWNHRHTAGLLNGGGVWNKKS